MYMVLIFYYWVRILTLYVSLYLYLLISIRYLAPRTMYEVKSLFDNVFFCGFYVMWKTCRVAVGFLFFLIDVRS